MPFANTNLSRNIIMNTCMWLGHMQSLINSERGCIYSRKSGCNMIYLVKQQLWEFTTITTFFERLLGGASVLTYVALTHMAPEWNSNSPTRVDTPSRHRREFMNYKQTFNLINMVLFETRIQMKNITTPNCKQ